MVVGVRRVEVARSGEATAGAARSGPPGPGLCCRGRAPHPGPRTSRRPRRAVRQDGREIIGRHRRRPPRIKENPWPSSPEHREHLAELLREGTLLLSGPLDDGSEALLIVVADSAEDALAKLDGDPFKRERVIVDRVAREWKVVIGELPGA